MTQAMAAGEVISVASRPPLGLSGRFPRPASRGFAALAVRVGRMWRETNQQERDLITQRRRIGECAALACELCARARATVWWRVAEFAVEHRDPYGHTVYLSGERLSTCYRCRDLIDQDQWDRVRQRRLAPLARHQEQLWEGLRYRIIGQPATMRL